MIKVDGLTKVYKQPVKEPGVRGSIKHFFKPIFIDKVAVDDISFSIVEGESVAYLGKNGAGKSTTIKMLTGIMQPSLGNILVDNINPQKNRNEYNKKIGVVFGQRTQLWWDIPIIESFKLIKDIYDIDNKTYKDNLDNFIEILGLSEFIHLSARRISLGQRMRADVAASLLHNPKILYLDEPTLGLDIVAKQKIREFINFVNKENKTTVLLTTHDIDDIEKICDRLILIDKGKVVYDGRLDSIIEKYARTKTIYFVVENTNIDSIVSEELKSRGIMLEKVDSKEVSVTFNRFEIPTREVISNVISLLTVEDIRIEQPGFEYILKQVYEGDLMID